MAQTSDTVDLSRYIGTAQAAIEFGISQPQLSYLCRRGPEKEGLRCIKFTERLWLIEIESLTAYNERIRELGKSGHLRGRPRKSKTSK